MSAPRRLTAMVAGLTQAIGGVVLVILSIDSLGLVGSDGSSFNWILAPAIFVLATIGLTVALIGGQPHWLLLGLGSLGAAAVLAGLGSLMTDSLGIGFVVFVLVQLAPAVVPERPSSGQPVRTPS